MAAVHIQDLPNTFGQLVALNKRLGTFDLEGLNLDESASADVFRLFSAFSPEDYESKIPDRLWRKLPLAISGKSGRCILENSQLRQIYWNKRLPQVSRTRMKRWLRPLVASYFLCFDRSSDRFVSFFKPLQNLLIQHKECLSEELKSFLEKRFFEVQSGPELFAKELLGSDKTLEQFCQASNLWTDFPHSNFVKQAFFGLASIDPKLLRPPLATKNLLNWIGSPRKPRYPVLSKIAAEAALLPWMSVMPSQPQLVALRSFILESPYLGNPDRDNPNWEGIDPACKEIFKKWMIGQSLDAFFEVLQNTADDIWKYREKFWRTYFSLGAIEEVWLVLGFDAERFIRRHPEKYGSLKFGTFYSPSAGVARNHSLLLIRIGDIEFAEWSHNGSLRARYLPKDHLYKPSKCYGDDYKYDSLDFHSGMNERPQLAHHHSASGGWQTKARNFILKNTGINAQVADVCLK